VQLLIANAGVVVSHTGNVATIFPPWQLTFAHLPGFDGAEGLYVAISPFSLYLDGIATFAVKEENTFFVEWLIVPYP
jgi:hypothetical protein